MLRKLIVLCGAMIAFGQVAPALAEYPDHPIQIIVPFPPGGAADVVARIMAQQLNAELHQTLIVENKPGAGGNIGGAVAARAAPDGYTLLLAAAGPTVINPSLYKNMPFDPIKDFAPVALVQREYNLLAVNPSLPVKTLGEFIAYAKAHPGISFGSPGNGTPAHLAGELFNQRADVKTQHVPYKGSAPAVSDLIAGHTVFEIDNMSILYPPAKSGTLRAIAIASDHRVEAAPDVPTFAEAGMKDFVITAWKGLMVPAKTPQAIIDTLNVAINKVLAKSDVKKRFIDLGGEAAGGTPADFAAVIKQDTEFYSALVKTTGAVIN